MLVREDASLAMLVAEDRFGHIIVEDLEVVRHLIPIVDPATSGGTSHMSRSLARLELALDYSTLAHLMAKGARDFHQVGMNLALNRFLPIIRIPYPLEPVNTDGVSPEILVSTSGNRL